MFAPISTLCACAPALATRCQVASVFSLSIAHPHLTVVVVFSGRMELGSSNSNVLASGFHTTGVVTVQSTPQALKGISPKHPVGAGRQMTLNGKNSQLPGVHRKPNCSYNCLIGMALKGSKRKCLPVNEIYAFFL